MSWPLLQRSACILLLLEIYATRTTLAQMSHHAPMVACLAADSLRELAQAEWCAMVEKAGGRVEFAGRPGSPLYAEVSLRWHPRYLPLLKRLRGLPELNLRRLRLDGTLLNGPGSAFPGLDEELAILATIPSLHRLEIRYCRFTPKGLEHLAAMANVKELQLYNCWLGKEHFRAIARLKNLRGLALDNTTGTNEQALEPLTALHELEDVDLGDLPVGDGAVHYLASSLKIKRLSLQARGLTNQGAARLAGFTRIEHLVLHSGPLSDRGIASLAGLTKLRTLRVSGGTFTDAGLAQLRNLTDMRDLALYYNQNLTGAGLAHLGRMTLLESLDLSVTGVTDASLQQLRPLSNLRRFWLSFTGVTGTGLKDLTGFSRLTELSLAGCATDEGLRALPALPALTTLDLWDAKVTNQGLLQLKRFASLRRVLLVFEPSKEVRRALPGIEFELVDP